MSYVSKGIDSEISPVRGERRVRLDYKSESLHNEFDENYTSKIVVQHKIYYPPFSSSPKKTPRRGLRGGTGISTGTHRVGTFSDTCRRVVRTRGLVGQDGRREVWVRVVVVHPLREVCGGEFVSTTNLPYPSE